MNLWIKFIAIKILAWFVSLWVLYHYPNKLSDTFHYYQGAKAIAEAWNRYPQWRHLLIRWTWQTFPNYPKELLPVVQKSDLYGDALYQRTKYRYQLLLAPIATIAFQSFWLFAFWVFLLSLILWYPVINTLTHKTLLFPLIEPIALLWSSIPLKELLLFPLVTWIFLQWLYNELTLWQWLKGFFILFLTASLKPPVGLLLLLCWISYGMSTFFTPAKQWLVILLTIVLVMLSYPYWQFVHEYVHYYYLYSYELKPQTQRYWLGNYEPTFQGLLTLSPKAFLIGLCYPLPWKVHGVLKVMAILQNIECLLLLVCCGYLFCHFKKALRELWYHPSWGWLMLFSVVYITLSGMSAASYGTLLRYKLFGYIGILLLFTYWCVKTNDSESKDSTAPAIKHKNV